MDRRQTEDENMTLCLPRPSSGRNTGSPRIVATQKPREMPQSHVLLRVDRFGFSANNVTYQALGEHPHFRYFDFHAPPEADDVNEKSHGLIPVWGFATVVESTHPKIYPGERYAFYVPRPHLPADRRPYNQILRCATDPQYTSSPRAEDLTMLYRPLFWTSYWFEDWLWSSSYRGGASTILISSASSKTAFCLAYLIGKRNTGTRVLGLTSSKNLAFTQGLGLYDDVLEYTSFASSPAFHGARDEKWVYVDVAGSTALNRRIFDHFASPYASTLAAVITLGLTNLSPSDPSVKWSQGGFSSTPPTGPTEEQFFMPEWLDVRRKQLSLMELFTTQQKAWKELMSDCQNWVEIERVYGADAVQKSYTRIALEGVAANKGLIWSLWDSSAPVAHVTKL
ncbi:hypothetical protein BDZ89DRAFT_1069231 [Hymenopellis radicata]|nr:hypothetical protein BDZ89DRAFT_1069231 [Hymenopellis radicata]